MTDHRTFVCIDHEDCRANRDLAWACYRNLRAALPVGKRVRFTVRPGNVDAGMVRTGIVAGLQYWPDFLVVRLDDGRGERLYRDLSSSVWRFEPIEGEGDGP